MNYHNITKCDMNNGEGLRVVLWVSGCEHKCKNCQNPQTWGKDTGILFDESAKQEIFEELSKTEISGITFSGGDPLAHYNRESVFNLINEIHDKFPKKNIWVYTGYMWEDVKDLEGIEKVNVLVDGKYVEELNTPSPKWCGSTNQRVIDVPKTIMYNKVILKGSSV